MPRTTSRLQFGFGPTLVIPSATDLQLGSQRWSAGPAAVAVYTRGALVAGILANNIWSFAGNGDRPVNAMLIQPFININLANGWYIASSPSEVVQFSVLLDKMPPRPLAQVAAVCSGPVPHPSPPPSSAS